MIDKVYLIRNLSVDELEKSENAHEYSIFRSGQYLGAFVKVGKTYHFRDQHHNTWVCACSNIDTGAENIKDAVAAMSY